MQVYVLYGASFQETLSPGLVFENDPFDCENPETKRRGEDINSTGPALAHYRATGIRERAASLIKKRIRKFVASRGELYRDS